jgi:hypothetical protein
MMTGWAVVLASAVAALVTGATAILTQFLTVRHEYRRLEAERKDKLLALLVQPRLDAHRCLVQFLVELRRHCYKFVEYGNEFHETKDPSEWRALSELNEAEDLYAANRLWLGPRVAHAFEEVISSLGNGASCAIGVAGYPGDTDSERLVESVAGAIYRAAEKCESTVQAALGIPDLDRTSAASDSEEPASRLD